MAWMLSSFWASNTKKDSINRLNNRIQRLRCLAFLPLDLVGDGFEQLRGEYVDPINLVLGQERAPLIAEFMT